jgi:ABC-type glycerol-3-phosphate transport system substrate-binding protein
VAIQAHDGKAAAVTAFEWVKSMGGDPLTLKGPKAREAFKRLWKLAPYLEPESKNIQFDTANNFLIANKVSVVDNWTDGIKVVMGAHKKKNIKVTRGLPGSFHVLGGDVLAIPTGISKEREERAIKLIEQLVAKETQRALAEKLFWAPVREDVYEDVYNDLSVQEARKEYFQVIRDADIRPITPYWDMVQKVLSKALQKVLEQDPARKTLATDAQIDAHIDDLLNPFIADLEKIPREIMPCLVVERAKITGDESCQVEVETDISYRDLASKLNKDAATLAMFNGRGELGIVSPKKTQVILVLKWG